LEVQRSSKTEWAQAIQAQLLEEVQEASKSPSLEGLVEIVELLEAWTKALGYSLEQISGLRSERLEQYGAFEANYTIEAEAPVEYISLLEEKLVKPLDPSVSLHKTSFEQLRLNVEQASILQERSFDNLPLQPYDTQNGLVLDVRPSTGIN
jgi:predicted house-cleaning noncanonical NTP pyrophosphatase (MazG superfamily)